MSPRPQLSAMPQPPSAGSAEACTTTMRSTIVPERLASAALCTRPPGPGMGIACSACASTCQKPIGSAMVFSAIAYRPTAVPPIGVSWAMGALDSDASVAKRTASRPAGRVMRRAGLGVTIRTWRSMPGGGIQGAASP